MCVFFSATLFHTFSLSLAFSLSLLLVRVHCNVLVFLIGRVLKFKLWVWLHLNQSNKISLLFFASQLQNPMISNKYFHFSFYTFIWIFNVFHHKWSDKRINSLDFVSWTNKPTKNTFQYGRSCFESCLLPHLDLGKSLPVIIYTCT